MSELNMQLFLFLSNFVYFKIISNFNSNPELKLCDRFDVVIDANQNIGTYWIYVRGVGACAADQAVNQFALLRYSGSNQELPPSPNEPSNGVPRRLNSPNNFCNSTASDYVCLNQVIGAIPPPYHVTHNSQRKNLVIQFGFYAYTLDELYKQGTYRKFYIPVVNPDQPVMVFKAMLNNISFGFPSSPFLYQRGDIPNEEFCPRRCYENYGDPANCDCVNFYSVPLRNTVNIIVTDTSPYDPRGLTHPFHLHGYDFYVLEMGVFPGDHDEGLRSLMNRLNYQGINNPSPALKDTIGIPAGGYAVVAIYTDNPGYWLFHCHFLYHLEMGMGAVLQTGDHSEMIQPPRDFPRCESYTPNVNF